MSWIFLGCLSLMRTELRNWFTLDGIEGRGGGIQCLWPRDSLQWFLSAFLLGILFPGDFHEIFWFYLPVYSLQTHSAIIS